MAGWRRRAQEPERGPASPTAGRGADAERGGEDPKYEMVDFGGEVGEVRISTRHPLRGEIVAIPYTVWGIDSAEISYCEFLGWCASQRRYALRSAEDDHVYPFTRAALSDRLTPEQRADL